MKTFKQFIRTLSEEKKVIRGNLCHEFGKFTPCDASLKSRPKRKQKSVANLKPKSVTDIAKNGTYENSEGAHEYLIEKGFDPSEVIKSVVGVDVDNKFDGRVLISKDSENVVFVFAENYTYHKTGAHIKTCIRYLDFNKSTVEHDLLTLERDSQGANTVKELYKDALPVYKKLKMKKIKLFANLSAGGYAWAKYGFEPDDKEQITNTVEIAQQRLDIFIKDAKVTDPKTLKEHAALTKLLSKPINDKIIRKIANVKTKHLDKVLNEYPTIVNRLVRERNFPPNFKMSAAKFMLINASWDGTLELKGESLKRLKTYINQ